jgi:ketosteroid isomerase-like protein
MMTGDAKSMNEAAISEAINNFVQAVRAKDMTGVMSAFSSEVVSFDLGPPLQHGGGQPFTERWKELFESYAGPIEYEVRELDITAGDDVAFSHSLNRISGTRNDGRKSDRWLRWTACYRKANGKWLIVHEQVSVPVDVLNGKALLDLKP